MLDLLGLPPLAGDGRSLAPWLARRGVSPIRSACCSHEMPADPAHSRAILAGRYKLIARDGGPRLLYDRVLDPRETEDIAAAGGELVRRAVGAPRCGLRRAGRRRRRRGTLAPASDP